MDRSVKFDIPKIRAEYPFLIVCSFFIFAGWAVHYGFFGWQGGGIWLGIFVPLFTILYLKKRGPYFIRAGEDAIEWRKDIISRYVLIPWKYLQRVDYLVFEINFKIKESGQVVSFPTSGLTESQTDELKQFISDIIREKLESGELQPDK